jgi:hypothetical protein
MVQIRDAFLNPTREEQNKVTKAPELLRTHVGIIHRLALDLASN